MDSTLASMLGNAPLSSSFLAYPQQTDGGNTSVLSGNVSNSASLQVGQISLGVLAVGIIGLTMFYLWTKGVQK